MIPESEEEDKEPSFRRVFPKRSIPAERSRRLASVSDFAFITPGTAAALADIGRSPINRTVVDFAGSTLKL
jgi:hypothetical protein